MAEEPFEVHAWDLGDTYKSYAPELGWRQERTEPRRRVAAFEVGADGKDKAAYADIRPEVTETVFPPHTDDPDPRYNDHGYLTEYGEALKKDPEFERTGNAPLFYHTTFPAEVHELHSTEGSSRLARTVLGVAAREHYQKTGKLPVASSELSPQSSSLVRRLLGKGLIERNSDNPTGRENVGDIGHMNPFHVINLGAELAKAANYDFDVDDEDIIETRVPDEDVRLGQQFASDVMRGRVNNGNS